MPARTAGENCLGLACSCGLQGVSRAARRPARRPARQGSGGRWRRRIVRERRDEMQPRRAQAVVAGASGARQQATHSGRWLSGQATLSWMPRGRPGASGQRRRNTPGDPLAPLVSVAALSHSLVTAAAAAAAANPPSAFVAGRAGRRGRKLARNRLAWRFPGLG